MLVCDLCSHVATAGNPLAHVQLQQEAELYLEV